MKFDQIAQSWMDILICLTSKSVTVWSFLWSLIITIFGFGNDIFAVHTIFIPYGIVYVHISATYSYTISVSVKMCVNLMHTVHRVIYRLFLIKRIINQRLTNGFAYKLNIQSEENRKCNEKYREVDGSNHPRIETLWIETSWKGPKPWATRKIIVNCALIRNDSI